MEIHTEAFEANGMIPTEYARDGGDKSPDLEWSGLPPKTKALALIVEDPDAPSGTFTHWLMWDIPVTRHGLPEDLSHAGDFADGARQGDNDFDERGYSGPQPPRGTMHRYRFKLFALDAPLKLEEGARRLELLTAMKGHVLDQAEIVGRYRR
jgi:Raf kinase inhibitor-like YbhB/YbcL family protein